ncbi:uncharacterized protein LOC130629789 [Hydractinia symbiolongicarpus]|uniref:uncharacterized protein LOC130629789 n=1 Tax=Hydractinia symbiolongicarpus TaxID=13093 RepID=UPI00254E42E8|nr:uncharacterized protein LOC130629789 [Hydractinia symbiolongicarpus]
MVFSKDIQVHKGNYAPTPTQQNSTLPVQDDKKKIGSFELYIIVAACTFVVLVVFIIIVVCACRRKRRKQSTVVLSQTKWNVSFPKNVYPPEGSSHFEDDDYTEVDAYERTYESVRKKNRAQSTKYDIPNVNVQNPNTTKLPVYKNLNSDSQNYYESPVLLRSVVYQVPPSNPTEIDADTEYIEFIE